MHHGGIRVAAAASGLTALLLGQLTLAHQAGADSTCTGSTLVVCVQVDPVLDGDEQVVTTVTDNGTAAAVDWVRFTWDADNDPGTTNQYLLTDHDAAWQMLLRSQRLPDGPGTLRVQAFLTDGRTASTAATVQVSSSQPLPTTQPFMVTTAAAGADGRVRLAAVGWARSFVRDAARREMLFDLDTARRQLFAREGKSAEYDLVSKSLANLLRMWVED